MSLLSPHTFGATGQKPGRAPGKPLKNKAFPERNERNSFVALQRPQVGAAEDSNLYGMVNHEASCR
jgi:hypothetical protein